MEMSGRVQIGDVVRSPRFVYGDTDSSGVLTVGHCYEETVFDEESKEHRSTGKLLPGASCDSVDESRASAQYVVEETGMQGGGTGHGPHDVYPDGWHVTARRLNEDGSYNPEGELIRFYQSGAFTYMAPEVEVVKRMKMSFA